MEKKLVSCQFSNEIRPRQPKLGGYFLPKVFSGLLVLIGGGNIKQAPLSREPLWSRHPCRDNTCISTLTQPVRPSNRTTTSTNHPGLAQAATPADGHVLVPCPRPGTLVTLTQFQPQTLHPSKQELPKHYTLSYWTVLVHASRSTSSLVWYSVTAVVACIKYIHIFLCLLVVIVIL